MLKLGTNANGALRVNCATGALLPCCEDAECSPAWIRDCDDASGFRPGFGAGYWQWSSTHSIDDFTTRLNVGTIYQARGTFKRLLVFVDIPAATPLDYATFVSDVAAKLAPLENAHVLHAGWSSSDGPRTGPLGLAIYLDVDITGTVSPPSGITFGSGPIITSHARPLWSLDSLGRVNFDASLDVGLGGVQWCDVPWDPVTERGVQYSLTAMASGIVAVSWGSFWTANGGVDRFTVRQTGNLQPVTRVRCWRTYAEWLADPSGLEPFA